VIVIRRPEDAAAWLAAGTMRCPRCDGALAKWGSDDEPLRGRHTQRCSTPSKVPMPTGFWDVGDRLHRQCADDLIGRFQDKRGMSF
jgi:hypothetical protein